MDLDRKGKLPVPIGIFAATKLQFEQLPIQMLEFTQAANLVDLAGEYDLAILQLPFLTIPFETSLLGVYVGETNHHIEPQLLVSPRIPFVVGFPQVLGKRGIGWDHKLIVMTKGSAAPLISWLQTVAFNDPKQDIGYRIRNQMCMISDVYEFEKHTQEYEVSTLMVPTLCVEMTCGSYYFKHKQKIGLTYPVLVHERTVQPDFDEFLRRLKAGDSDLYGVNDAISLETGTDGRPNLLYRGDDDQDGRSVGNGADKPGG